MNEELTDLQILDDFTDLERLNFLTWYQCATQDDIELGRKNNSEKFHELLDKYKYDLAFMSAV